MIPRARRPIVRERWRREHFVQCESRRASPHYHGLARPIWSLAKKAASLPGRVEHLASPATRPRHHGQCVDDRAARPLRNRVPLRHGARAEWRGRGETRGAAVGRAAVPRGVITRRPAAHSRKDRAHLIARHAAHRRARGSAFIRRLHGQDGRMSTGGENSTSPQFP